MAYIMKIIFRIIATLTIVYTFMGFVLIPYLIQTNFSQTFTKFTSANGYLEKVYINPYTFEVELTNLLIQDEKDKTLLFFNKFSLDFEVKSLFDEVLLVKSIILKDFKSNIVLDDKQIINFQFILDFLNKQNNNQKTQTPKDINPLKIRVEDIQLLNNRIAFWDYSKSTSFHTKTKHFDIKLKNISIVPNDKGHLDFDINFIDTARLKLNTNISLNPIGLDGKVEVQNIRTNKIYHYIKDDIDFKLSGDRIDLVFDYNLGYLDEKLTVDIKNINTQVQSLKYNQDDISVELKSLINIIPHLTLTKQNNSLDIKLNGKLDIENINLATKKDLVLNINNIDTSLAYKVDFKNDNIKIIVDDTNILANSIKYKTKEFNIDLNNLTNTIKQINITKKAEDKTIKLSSSDIGLENTKLIFTDLTKEKPINLAIKNIKATVPKITLDKNIPIEFDLNLDAPTQGKITTTGKVVINPLDIYLDIKTQNVTVLPYLAYIQEFVNIYIESGNIYSNIIVKLKEKDKKVQPTIIANINLNSFDIFHTLTNQRLTSFKQLKVENLQFKTDDLSIEKVILDKSYLKFAIAEDKTTNFDNITVENTTTTKEDKEENKEEVTNKPTTFQYFIKEFELKDSKSDFSDLSLPLQFATKIHSLKANIKDISSNDVNTNLKLNGIVDEYGMATISGALNLANYKKKTDIKLDFENLDITSFSPYSTKFIGNKIDTGKLWLDLEYKIRDSQLSSTNNMRIKDITLGEKIKSEDAMDLPVGLFIALLEDSEGFIDVSVPINGDIDNPEFEFAGAIWSAIGNVITNIITSPFRFLSSLIGISSDELGNMEFDYGMSVILPTQKEKLDNLAKAFNQKPKLSLLLTSTYAITNDLRYFQRKKLLSILDKKEKDKSLNLLFIKEFGEKEFLKIKKENKSEEKSIPIILVNKLIPTIKITPNTLDELAFQRSYEIKKYLAVKGLDENRIIIKPAVKNLISKHPTRINIKLDVDIK